jgi:hypothetical protein
LTYIKTILRLERSTLKMAEYDQALLDSMIDAADEELAAYLESLSDMERKVMEEVLFRASAHRLTKAHLDNLKRGPIM